MLSKYFVDPPPLLPQKPRGWKSSFRPFKSYQGPHKKVFKWSVKHVRTQYKPQTSSERSHALAWLRTHEKLPSLIVWRQILQGTFRPKRDTQDERAEIRYSDVYECPNCGDRNVHYTQMQTRSADEGMTNFCQCMTCKHRWKEN